MREEQFTVSLVVKSTGQATASRAALKAAISELEGLQFEVALTDDPVNNMESWNITQVEMG